MSAEPDAVGPAVPSLLYSPLPSNGMRLLKPVSTSTGGDLEYELLVHDMYSGQPYYALSYVWGRPVADHSIICNGQSIGVTENLFQALQHLRRQVVCTDLTRRKPPEPIATAEACLWIDQLCINQADIHEKEQQIKRMQEIFSRAIRTVVWYSPDVSAQVAEYLALFGKIAISEMNPDLERFDVSMVNLPHADSTFWKEFHDFLTRPWTTRVWVIQEAALSRAEPVLICGNRAFGLQSLCHTIISITWLVDSNDDVRNALGPFKSDRFFGILRDLRDCFSELKEPPRRIFLTDLLYMLPNLQASDDRDLVYGVLGLTHLADGGTHRSVSIVPDYDRDVYEVFRTVARYGIKSTNSLLILTKAGQFGYKETGLDICQLERPSWTPMLNLYASDVASMMSTNVCRIDADMTVFCHVDVKFDATSGQPPEMRDDSSDSKLILRGLVMDTVKLVVPPAEEGDSVSKKNLTFIKQWETALGYFGIRDDALLSELTPFVKKFFLATYPFSWDNEGSQSLRSDNFQRLRPCVEKLHSAYRMEGVSNETLSKILENYAVLDVIRGGGGNESNDDGDTDDNGPLINNATQDAFFITKAGHLGLGPKFVQEEDSVALLYGGWFPYILRRCGNEFHLIGDAFIRGYMNGEAMPDEDGEKDGRKPEWINIH